MQATFGRQKGDHGPTRSMRGTGNGERGAGNGERGTGVWERVYSSNPPENSKWRIYKPLTSTTIRFYLNNAQAKP